MCWIAYRGFKVQELVRLEGEGRDFAREGVGRVVKLLVKWTIYPSLFYLLPAQTCTAGGTTQVRTNFA